MAVQWIYDVLLRGGSGSRSRRSRVSIRAKSINRVLDLGARYIIYREPKVFQLNPEGIDMFGSVGIRR